LSAWILDHRADARTMVRGEAATDWVPLGSLPDFAVVLAESARLHGLALPATSPDTPPSGGTATVELGRASRGEFELFDCLGRAWHCCSGIFC
jgi:hypothetical protein